MSHPSLSTLGKLENLLRVTNLTITRVSYLCAQYGISSCFEANLSRATKGGRPLPPDADLARRGLLLKIENLIQQAKPFELSFSNTDAVKQILDRIDDGGLWFAVVDTTEPVPTTE